ncbi:MAG: HD domain-containing protein [Candidatus Omnitrophica bacterium]|nr:HD domain-containing protein [Candidatus Omnitrophota bacterium]
MADNNKFSDKNGLLNCLLKNAELREEKRIFDGLTGQTSFWWFFDKNLAKKPAMFLATGERKHACKGILEAHGKGEFLKCILRHFNKAASLNHAIKFGCPTGFSGFIFPLILNGDNGIFVGVCHVKGTVLELALENLNIVIKVIAEKIKKEQELTKLYETIRPRAIALSTIHTVHRLIGSTLNLDELLPRIAHLKLNIERKVIESESVYIDKKCICVPLIDQEIIGTIRVEDKQDKNPFTNFDKEILTVLGEQAVIAIKNAQLYEERGNMLLGSIKSLSAMLDTRLPNTYTHPMGFVDIVLEIGKELKLPAENMEALKYAALLMDAGKISIPDEILMKPDKLTGKEYSLIKEHPLKGAEIVGSIDAMKPAIPLILHHHERYDGKGYPDGLKRDNIPIGARIIAVADAFEAMICKRPYKKGSLNIKDAVYEIKKAAGTQLDPIIVNAFFNLVKDGRLKNIVCRLQEKDNLKQ